MSTDDLTADEAEMARLKNLERERARIAADEALDLCPVVSADGANCSLPFGHAGEHRWFAEEY